MIDCSKIDRNTVIHRRVAGIILGASVIRVFVKGTKKKVYDYLIEEVNLEEIKNKTQIEYDKWLYTHIKALGKVIKKKNKRNDRIGVLKKSKGYIWGHSAKVMNLYISFIVKFSRFFNDKEMKRIIPLLHIPVDSKVAKHIKENGNLNLNFKGIKYIETKSAYKKIQKDIKGVLKGYPLVYYDDLAQLYRPLD